MSGAASRRLARGIYANLVAVATRVTVQFASLPIFFASWPSERIGSWMIVFAIPAYIALVGNGFAGAGGSAALAAAQSGNFDRARADFRTAWAISSAGTALLALLFVAMGDALAQLMASGLSGIPAGQLGPALGWLALYIFAASQMSVLDIAFRVAGRYPDHILLNALAQLADIVIIAACVTTSDSVVVLAMGLALTRALFVVVTLLIARSAVPLLFSRHAAPLKPSLAELWKPSLAFMIVPLVFGLNLQGYLLLVGTRYGPVLLAGFIATRTLTRLLDLFTNVVYGVQYYEAGYLGDERRSIQRRQLATMTAVTLVIAVLFSAAMLLAGDWMQSLYTLGKTRFDPLVAAVLLLAATVRALASSPMSVITSENRHARIHLSYLAGSSLAFAASATLAILGASLPVILSGLVLAELALTVPAFAAVLRRLDLTLTAFLRALVSRQRLADIAELMRLLLRKS